VKPESRMWQTLRPLLAELDPVRVENLSSVGTPDVNYVGGWIELKCLAAWPKKPETVVKVDHFTPEQRAWILRRCRAGGKVFVILRVANDWLLFGGAQAACSLGTWTKDRTLREAALVLVSFSGASLRKDLLLKELRR
jgi:hypothetical protein